LDNLEKSRRIKQIDDKRVHLMLYFFGNGSHTNACDFTLLQEFQKTVSILPVISMADRFNPKELHLYKLDIMNTAIDRKV
jgi:septin family protein